MTKRILCISLSEIQRDARVLRQIRLLAGLGEVTTVGFGGHPEGASAHIQVPTGLKTLPQTPAGVLKLALRAHRSAECTAPAAEWVLRQALPGPWDLIVANEARAMDLAYRLADETPIWVDLHEWAPGERTQILSWRLLVAPFMAHLCRRYLPKMAMSTTVSRGIISLYQEQFGVTPLFMPNAGPYKEIPVQPASEGIIRCVHSGAAQEGRALDTLIDVFRELPDRFTLDLFLVPGGDGGHYLRSLQRRAAGCDRIRFNDPVHAHELPTVLSDFDLGVHWIPAEINLNNRYALPNKFFDYVQARLGIAIGPSEEMSREVERYGLGVVAPTFAATDLGGSLLGVDAKMLNEFKENADGAARELNFDEQAIPVRSALKTLLTKEDLTA